MAAGRGEVDPDDALGDAARALLDVAHAQQKVVTEQQEKIEGTLRQLVMLHAEFARLSGKIDQGHEASQERVEAIARELEYSLAHVDEQISSYVAAALEKHQVVVSRALQEASDKAVEQAVQASKESAQQVLGAFGKAALSVQDVTKRAQASVTAFQSQKWWMLASAFLGGALVAVLTFMGALYTFGDADRRVELERLDRQVEAKRQELSGVQQEIDAARRGTRPAAQQPRPPARQ